MRVNFDDPGGLFNLAVRLMQLFSSSDQNFTELTRCDEMKRELCQTHFFQVVRALLPNKG